MNGGYLATLIISAVFSVAVTALIAYQEIKPVMRQVKLYHSINLVELRTRKIVYWIFAGILGFMIFYTVMQMADGESPCVVAFHEKFGVTHTLTNIALMFPLIVMIAAETLIVSLGVSRNAVVDKGVYTNFAMLDWHQVRDYIIDEGKCILVLSADRGTFSSLRHITTPFKVKKNDVEKLKFILNKNKNKFSDFEDA